MIASKDALIELIRYKAEQEAKRLAGQFLRAAIKDREAILAALDFEKELADSCEVSLIGEDPEGL